MWYVTCHQSLRDKGVGVAVFAYSSRCGVTGCVEASSVTLTLVAGQKDSLLWLIGGDLSAVGRVPTCQCKDQRF
jgi:hypothetical protein